MDISSESWKTKPTDRFILRWIKMNLSARITPRLAGMSFIRPWMITLIAMLSGIYAGIVYSQGCGFSAGLIALLSQTLDGVDGQLARLTNRQSSGGAFLRLLDCTQSMYQCYFLIFLSITLSFPV